MSADPNKPSFFDKFKNTQFYKSVFRTGMPVSTHRQRMMIMLNSVFLHLHPVRLPKHAVKVRYTWCMGGLSFFIFLVLITLYSEKTVPEWFLFLKFKEIVYPFFSYYL